MADKIVLFLLIFIIIGFFIVILIPTRADYCPQNLDNGLTCTKTYKYGWCIGIEGFYCPPEFISPLTSTDYYICNKDGLWNYCGSSCEKCFGKPPESCSYTSCIDCTASSYCGWCKPLGQCLLGTKSGVGDGICPGNDWVWTTKNCFGNQTTTTTTTTIARCRLDITIANPPPDTESGSWANAEIQVKNIGGSSCYGDVGCTFQDPSGIYRYPSHSCDSITAGSSKWFYPGMTVIKTGLWSVIYCGAYASSDSSCTFSAFNDEFLNVGQFNVFASTTTTTTTIPSGDNKYNIVFVPLYYSPDESGIFVHESLWALHHWLMRSPFKECPDPWSKINLYHIDPKDCQETCSDICKDCQDKVKDCVFNSEYRGKWNKIVGICKGESCKGLLGTCGCSDDIPSDSSVTNIGSSCNGDPGEQIVAHEMGHSFGLCHVSGCFSLGGCKEEPWCPNKDDCYVPNHKDFIMDYCSPMEQYGPAGYQFLKSEVFKDYLVGC